MKYKLIYIVLFLGGFVTVLNAQDNPNSGDFFLRKQLINGFLFMNLGIGGEPVKNKKFHITTRRWVLTG
jgi:hypothetical protein